jgi:ribosomal protein L37AE/L43A
MTYASHYCPRCLSQSMTRDSFNRRQCLLCGYNDPSSSPVDQASVETVAAIYTRANFYMKTQYGIIREISVQ